ncbi:conserved hypothetical protein [Histoplasma capsulatum G186AR]|uniref:Cytochrome P450 n=1 Tax=Ajellomyces capsulatus (strain G186AR / H82 / ATCC MYA-2454 / RMSCC 2432) TaxID=447093 RepID=C0NSU6_AJECG|nr:uncharacterized protein HCBG_06226 [Histoplasma capsulatum G186AR]EEH05962.1 conserved hypothetical protein [Histoplasma capsulatum G186AR]
MQGNRTIYKAHQKYGPIVRLEPSEISVNCVDGGIRTVYAGGFEKRDWYPRVFGAYGYHVLNGGDQTPFGAQTYSKFYLQASPHMAAISQAIICRHLLPVLQQNIQFQANVEVHGLINAIAMDFVPAYIFGLASGTNFLEDIPTARDWFRVYQSRKPFEFFYQVPRMTYLAKMLKIPLISKWSDKANQVMENWGLEMIDYAEKFLASTDPACEPVSLKQQRLELACEMLTILPLIMKLALLPLLIFTGSYRGILICRESFEELETLSPKIIAQSVPEIPTELPHPKAIDALPLLGAIVMETLRLHSPIPGIQPPITPAPSTTLAGYDDFKFLGKLE